MTRQRTSKRAADYYTTLDDIERTQKSLYIEGRNAFYAGFGLTHMDGTLRGKFLSMWQMGYQAGLAVARLNLKRAVDGMQHVFR